MFQYKIQCGGVPKKKDYQNISIQKKIYISGSFEESYTLGWGHPEEYAILTQVPSILTRTLPS